MTGFAVASPGTEIPYSTSVPMIRRALMRTEPNRSAPNPVRSGGLVVERPDPVPAEMRGDGLTDLAQRDYLFGRELVEQVGPNGLHMTRGGRPDRLHAGVGEFTHRAAPVGRAFPPADPTGLLHPG